MPRGTMVDKPSASPASDDHHHSEEEDDEKSIHDFLKDLSDDDKDDTGGEHRASRRRRTTEGGRLLRPRGTVADPVQGQDGTAIAAVPKRRSSKTNLEQAQQHNEEILEMNESIQSMMSFSDIMGIKEGQTNAAEGDVQVNNLDESLQSNLSISCSNLGMDAPGAIDDVQDINDYSNDAIDNMHGTLRLTTKSCCTATTAATTAVGSRDFTDPARFPPREGEDDDDDEDEDGADECHDVYPTGEGNSDNLPFITPAMRQSIRSVGSRTSRSSSVPQELHAARSVLVSPLSADPSPGHMKFSLNAELLQHIKTRESLNAGLPLLTPTQRSNRDPKNLELEQRHQIQLSQILHQDEDARTLGCRASYFIPGITAQGRTSMDSLHSRDFVPETPAPLRRSAPELPFFHGDDYMGDKSNSRRSNSSDATPSERGRPHDLYSPGTVSCSTVSSRRLQRLPRTSHVDNGNVTSAGAVPFSAAPNYTRTRSLTLLSADDDLDSGVTYSNSFAHLEERPPTPVKRRQRLRSKKDAFAPKTSSRSHDELHSRPKHIPATSILAAGTRSKESMHLPHKGDDHPETPQSLTSTTSNSGNSPSPRTGSSGSGGSHSGPESDRHSRVAPSAIRSESLPWLPPPSTMDQATSFVNQERNLQSRSRQQSQGQQSHNVSTPVALVGSRKPRSSKNLKRHSK